MVINSDHPGDHRLGENGEQVDAITLDSLLENSLRKTVSLIKVDVQGAEYKVISGALKLIQTFNPTLFLEVDEDALRKMGASSEVLFQLLKEQSYAIHYIDRKNVIGPISIIDAVERAKSTSYSDFLFIVMK